MGWLRRAWEIVATDAVPPTYASHAAFQDHALRNPANGWYEALMPHQTGTVGTVDRCLQLTAQMLGTMSLRYRHAEDVAGYQPSWITDPDPAWYPNGIADALHAAVWSIYSRGDAFLWCTSRYETGYPRTWTLLDPVTMQVKNSGAGVRSYRSHDVELDPRDVLQVSRNPTGALRGTGSVEAYWANVQSAAQAEAYAADVYASTGVNRVALKSARRLTAEQADGLQAQWVAAVQKRLGAPAILPPDLDLLQTLTISPKDLMLLESREWDAKQIAAAFGVPAMLLNITLAGGLAYQSPAMLVEQWWRTELAPRARLIEGALSRWLPRGHWVEFDPSAALRPDLVALQSTYSSLYADGAVTLDEYRAAVLDLPPLPGGDAAQELYEEAGAHGSAVTNGTGNAAEVVIP